AHRVKYRNEIRQSSIHLKWILFIFFFFFKQKTAYEIAAAKEAIKRLVLSLDEVKTRRLAPSRRGHIVDIRRTLRASLKAGGAIIDLKYLGPRRKVPPIVALLDISGSMSRYTRLF